MRNTVRAPGLAVICVLAVAGCRSTVAPTRRSAEASATATSTTGTVPRPCSLLTLTAAERVTGDLAVTNQGADVIETPYGYVACIFADPKHEANSAVVKIKRVSGGVDPSTLREAAAFFARGEPVQPFQLFAVNVGDQALGETTPGVAFIVFSSCDLLIYVGGGSAMVSAASLRAEVGDIARQIAAWL